MQIAQCGLGRPNIVRRWQRALAVTAAGLLAVPAMAGSPNLLLAQAANPAASSPQADLEALIKAAKAEGEFTMFFGPTENIAQRVVKAFTAKYGVKVTFTRLASTALLQRFATEAEAGTFSADLFITSENVQNFATNGIRRGWNQSISEAGLPVFKSSEFPARFNNGVSAVVQITPWLLTYNTEKLKGADIPRDWPDLLSPRFKGQILLPDPRSSDLYFSFWNVLLERYGESYFNTIRELSPRQYASGVPAVQALAAGEGALELPAVGPQVEGIRAKGGPLAMVKPDLTTGPVQEVALTARDKSKRPNAARLFANYILSPEGNKVFNDDPGGFSIYDTGSAMPKQFQFPRQTTAEQKEKITRLLGFQ